jgi:hypothetical protein
MPAGSAIRNRSETVNVETPRGPVEVARQQTRGGARGTSWRWAWLARRRGGGGWSEASTAREAIRHAMLLPPRKVPAWLNEAAAEAERQMTAVEAEEVDAPATGSPTDSDAT